jgi:hypothetical protein
MVASWERALPMQRAFFTYSAYTTDPILIDDLIVITQLLVIG